MIKTTLLFTLLFILANGKAQLTAEQRIQDSVIGWWSNTRFDHLKPQADALGKKKEMLVNKMLEWMKKTYNPVAGLGTYSRFITKLGYGVLFEVWDVSHDKEWTEANGNFKPIPEQNTPFWIAANRTFGSFSIPFMGKENEYYFTMQPNGYGANDQRDAQNKKADPRIHPNVYKYITWTNEWQTVYLTPNNKLPFIAVTKRELLQGAEEGLDKQLANEIKDVEAKWPGNKKAQDEALVYRKENIEKYRRNIQQLRLRHQSSLNEPAVIRAMQPTMYSFELDPDIFTIDPYEKGLNHAYPVFKVNPELYSKMQTDIPQWIAIAFPYANKEKGNQLYELNTALSQNFNYEYVYNYFFDPEKVKGMAYKPANEDQLLTRLENYRKKNSTAIAPVQHQAALPANVYFFDDFSSGNEGGDPPDWFYRKYGQHPVMVTLKNNPGKWLQLGYNTPVNPSLLKKPLPADFTVEYDMITDGGFTSRTGGAARLILNSRSALPDGTELTGGNGTRLSIEITAGNEADYDNNNYRGLASIKINSTPAVNKDNYSEGISYDYALREFTNKKSRVHVTVKVKAGIVSVLINNKQVAISTNFKMTYGSPCTVCGIPANTTFKSVFWNNTTNDADAVKVYIGNIKISKE